MADEMGHSLGVDATHEECETDQLHCCGESTTSENVLKRLGELCLSCITVWNVLVSPGRLDKAVDSLSDRLGIGCVDKLKLKRVEAVDKLGGGLLAEANRHGKCDGLKIKILWHYFLMSSMMLVSSVRSCAALL